ncbi:AraC family transcriptional regulator [Paenibacillus yanchengensis]|uniref:AraC family transcriptional regulator n=1 Tax=Paenibacillus yanchengensis TaxID=2035833 RepID=A0ABW4YGC2_9BACL
MRRVVPAHPSELLPLQLETIGINPEQESINRPDGYPYYHWLQTIEGEGDLIINRKVWKMTPQSGVLLAPSIPHQYFMKGSVWKTAYMTFHGNIAVSLIQTLGWSNAERFNWEANNDAITKQLYDLLSFAETRTDPSGWQYSAELYRFLTLLRTNAHTYNRPSMINRLERMHNLLLWLESEFSNPDITLAQMATQLDISQRQLNERFRQLFGQTAYAYLLQLRLRKAKEWLPAHPDWTVRQIGEAVGFRDTSHFVATFRQKEGMTPDAYRQLFISKNV